MENQEQAPKWATDLLEVMTSLNERITSLEAQKEDGKDDATSKKKSPDSVELSQEQIEKIVTNLMR